MSRSDRTPSSTSTLSPYIVDIFTIAKIRSLSKQRKRLKRLLTESKQSYSEEDVARQRAEIEKRRKADDLIQTIKAMELVGGDTKWLKLRLREVLISTKSST